jgi:hypothetical protein
MKQDAWQVRDALKAQYKKNKQFVANIFNDVRLTDIKALIVELGLTEDEELGGNEFSIEMNKTWAWSVYKSNVGAIHLLDLHGVNAEITVMSNTKDLIELLYTQLVERGMIKTIEEKREARAEKAAKRMAALEKKGLKIGSEVAWSNGNAVIESISPAGVVTLRLQDGTPEKTKPHFLKAAK